MWNFVIILVKPDTFKYAKQQITLSMNWGLCFLRRKRNCSMRRHLLYRYSDVTSKSLRIKRTFYSAQSQRIYNRTEKNVSTWNDSSEAAWCRQKLYKISETECGTLKHFTLEWVKQTRVTHVQNNTDNKRSNKQ